MHSESFNIEVNEMAGGGWIAVCPEYQDCQRTGKTLRGVLREIADDITRCRWTKREPSGETAGKVSHAKHVVHLDMDIEPFKNALLAVETRLREKFSEAITHEDLDYIAEKVAARISESSPSYERL